MIRLEQINVIDALDNNYFPQLMSSYDMINDRVEKPAFFESAAFKSTLAFNLNEINTLMNLYKRGIDRIHTLQNEHFSTSDLRQD